VPTMAAWLHQLTATPGPAGQLSGWGARDGKAMITTRPPPPRRNPRRTPEAPHTALTTRPRPRNPEIANRRDTRAISMPKPTKPASPHDLTNPKINSASYSRNRV
jgi:hypothetical protein